jgi:hypothetical protein
VAPEPSSFSVAFLEEQENISDKAKAERAIVVLFFSIVMVLLLNC